MIKELLSENGLSFERLKHFVLVAEAGSIRAVSEGDPARQSLISRQIRELEIFFGTELTRRRGRGLEITASGMELARHIRLQFQALSDFKQTQAGASLEVRMAAGNSVLEWMLIPALGSLGTAGRRIRWNYRVLRTRESVDSLLNHSIDFALIRKSAVVRPLKYHHLIRVGYALLVPECWPERDATEILEGHPWAMTIGGEFRRQFESEALKAGITLKPTHSCTSFTQAARLAAEGVAAAVLPEMGRFRENVRKLALPWLSGYSRSIGLVWHPRNLEVRTPLAEIKKRLIEVLG